MTDIASLALKVDSRDVGTGVQRLGDLTRAGAQAESATDRLSRSHNKLATEARSASAANGLLVQSIGAIGIAAAAGAVMRLADSYTSYTNQLKVAGLEGRKLAGVQNELFATAQKYGTQLEALGTLYGRLAPAAKELGASQADLLKFTNAVAAGIKIQGGSAEQASGALLQLSQALGGSVVRTEEFNSVLEGARPLAQAAADNITRFGGSVSKLRAEVVDGTVTSREFFEAILKGSAALDAQASKANLTIAASFQVLNNALGKYIGEADAQFSATQRISQAIIAFSKTLETIVPVIALVIGYVGVRWAAAGAVFLATEAARQVALLRTIGAMGALRGAAGGLLALLGGVWGIAFTGAAAAVFAVVSALDAAKTTTENAKASTQRYAEAMEIASKYLGDAATSAAKFGANNNGAVAGTNALAGATADLANKTFALASARAEAARQALAEARAANTKEINRLENPSLATRAGRFLASPVRGTKDVDADRAQAERLRAQNAALLAQEIRVVVDPRSGKADPAAITATTTAIDKQAKAAKTAAKEVSEYAKALQETTRAGEQYLANLQRIVAEEGLSESQRTKREGDLESLIQMAAGNKALAEAIDAVTAARVRQLQASEGLKELEAANDNRNQAVASAPNSTPYADIAEELRLIDGLAIQAGNGLANAFGTAGEALAGVVDALSGYRTQLAEIAAAEERGQLTAAQGARERSATEVRAYGNMANAAKGFFKQGSAGYKALEIAEKAYRAVEFAMSVKSLFFKSAETAATVAGAGIETAAVVGAEAAKTAATAAGTAVRTPLKIAEGAASMFAALGPFGFAAVGAMLAVMAALGFSGGSGGGSIKLPTAEDRQKAQGTGTVLGDATAKSDSIARSLEIVAANGNKDLEYSNAMLRSLRSIDANIGALTDALARQLGINGAFDTSDLSLGTSGKAATLMNLGFGKTTTRTLQDQGLSFGAQGLNDILGGGLSGSTYQDVLEQTKKKAFGITISNKSKVTTSTTSIDDDLAAEFTRVIASLRDGVLQAASVLGLDGAKATLDAFVVNLGTISLKDLKPDEIKAALDAVFGKLGDEMAAAILGDVGKFQKAGEGAFETLIRVARGYQVLDTTLSSIGLTFGAVGAASLVARERLIDLAGGLDSLQEKTAAYADAFLTDAERLAPVQEAVTAELQRLGLQSVTTKDQFKAVVSGLDLTTEGGATLYAALLDLAPAFAKVTEAAEQTATAARDTADKSLAQAKTAVDDAKGALVTAFNRESADLKSTIDAFSTIAKTLQAQSAKLAGSQISANPLAQYNSAKSAFAQAAAAVRANPEDRAAYATLQTAGDALVTASKASSTSAQALNTDIAGVRAELLAASVTAQGQADTAQASLDQLTLVVGKLVELNANVLTIPQAIEKLTAATNELVIAQAGRDKAYGVATNDNIDLSRYAALNPDLVANWNEGGVMRNMGATLEEALRSQYATYGKDEIAKGLRDKFATGGEFTVGGSRSGDQTPVNFMANGGEVVNVSRADNMAKVAAALERQNQLLERQNQLLADDIKANRKTADTLVRVTRDGESLLTEAA